MQKKIINHINFFIYKLISLVFSTKEIKTTFGRFKLLTNTPNEVHRSLTFNEKEPETISWINSFKNEVGAEIVFFDVGANIGIYSLYACLRHPQSKIYSFEPDSQSFASLNKNIYINKFKATPFPIALSNESGIGSVYLSSMSAGAGACALGDNYKFSNEDSWNIFKQGIFFCTLDDLVFKFGLPCPNYIKIDVDGIEEKILSGARQVLKSNNLKGILVEFQYKKEDDLHEIINELASIGFQLVSKSNWVAEFNGLSSRNYIFSR
jgi:FkbM family methyltransferase